MDVRFYTLDFSELHILPEQSKDIGYISMDAEIEFCGTGTFQLVFHDNETVKFIKKHPEGLLIDWGDFQGYFTDYQFAEKKKWIFGSHINALLHKFVIPNQSISGDLQSAVQSLIAKYTPFTFVENAEGFGDITFSTEKYQNLDTFLIALATEAGIGYRVYIKNRVIYFELRKANRNPLMLSKNNRNVYEAQEDFSNKTAAYGGWYQKTKEDDGTEAEPVWVYISSADKTGIYKQDVVLNAASPSEAKKELAGYVAIFDTDCKTRNITYGVDYNLGDIVRYQSESATVLKQVSKISLWHEKSTYHEEPTLTEWEANNV